MGFQPQVGHLTQLSVKVETVLHTKFTNSISHQVEKPPKASQFPEPIGGSLTLKLTIEQQLEQTIELFLVTEKFSQFFITSEGTVLKNTVMYLSWLFSRTIRLRKTGAKM